MCGIASLPVFIFNSKIVVLEHFWGKILLKDNLGAVWTLLVRF